ncbi:MAG: arginine repressor [Lachnospiraceae bacterium]|mgnify:CR=1 FL=1|nr:arginine repressor [Lachnospiraceae bacterium]MEE1341928.1 arginine repressor [Lachnospiraceae bacterium]
MKAKRQQKIIELIEKHDIETQDELAERLEKAGFVATQATISRDIREMKLTKMATPNGKQKYVVFKKQDYDTTMKYKRVLMDAITSIEIAQNIVVIKTVSGMAMAVAAAIDNLEIKGIVGSIAGDDTIMCVIKTNEEAKTVVAAIKKVAKESVS